VTLGSVGTGQRGRVFTSCRPDDTNPEDTQMSIRMLKKSVYVFLFGTFASLIGLALPPGESNVRKYVKKDTVWYAEENGKLYRIIPNLLSVKFKVGLAEEEVEQVINKYLLKIKNRNRLGVYELEVVDGRDSFEVLHELTQSESVGFAEVNTIGEYIVDETEPTEVIIQQKRFRRKNGKWYLESTGRLYEVIPQSLTLKFKEETTLEQRREFLHTYQLTVVGKNRLGIYDVKIACQKNSVDYFGDLHDHELLEFIEVNSRGVYEKE
jgi:hypothetical protein